MKKTVITMLLLAILCGGCTESPPVTSSESEINSQSIESIYEEESKEDIEAESITLSDGDIQVIATPHTIRYQDCVVELRDDLTRLVASAPNGTVEEVAILDLLYALVIEENKHGDSHSYKDVEKVRGIYAVADDSFIYLLGNVTDRNRHEHALLMLQISVDNAEISQARAFYDREVYDIQSAGDALTLSVCHFGEPKQIETMLIREEFDMLQPEPVIFDGKYQQIQLPEDPCNPSPFSEMQYLIQNGDFLVRFNTDDTSAVITSPQLQEPVTLNIYSLADAYQKENMDFDDSSGRYDVGGIYTSSGISLYQTDNDILLIYGTMNPGGVTTGCIVDINLNDPVTASVRTYLLGGICFETFSGDSITCLVEQGNINAKAYRQTLRISDLAEIEREEVSRN